jgi:Protein of unknown function (DUF4239)
MVEPLPGILVVFLAMLAAIPGLSLVRRLTPLLIPQEHNDVAGFLYAVLGIAYAVLLAFLVIAVWERFEAARDAADQEGNELAGIYWLADTFPDTERQQVQGLARSYAQVVIDEECVAVGFGAFVAYAVRRTETQRGPGRKRRPRTGPVSLTPHVRIGTEPYY